LTGTLYPLVLDALEGVKISVGPPYYAATVIPLLAILAMFMPIAPILLWRRGDLRAALYALRYAAAAGGVAIAITLAIARPISFMGMLAIGLGVWLIAGSVTDIGRRAGSWRRLSILGPAAWSVALAHAGLGVTALGIAGTTVWRTEVTEVVAPGGTMNIAGYTLRLDSTQRVEGPNYFADQATITLMADGKTLSVIHPEKRSYPVEGMVTTNSSIRTTGLADLYVVLGDAREGGGWVIRVYHSPLAPLIWIGAVIMAMAGFIGVGSRILARVRASRAAAGVATAEAASP
jgi:cytochrome c-type biogenesis protein CcmF